MLTPQDLLKLLAQFGCNAGLAEAKGDAPPYCVVQDGRERYAVVLDGPAPGNRYATIRFMLVLKERTPASPETLNAIHRGLRFATLWRDSDGDLRVTMDVRIAGGVTAAFLQGCIDDWAAVRNEVRRLLRAAERKAGKSTA
jgi:hypothetical protein